MAGDSKAERFFQENNIVGLFPATWTLRGLMSPLYPSIER